MLISPIILCLLVVGIFFFPNVLGHYILEPAMASIYPTFPTTSELTPHIHAWHGINAELLMTVGVIIIGIILFKTLKAGSRSIVCFHKSIRLIRITIE